MSSKYFNELNEKDQDIYLTKLRVKDSILPDPLDADVRKLVFIHPQFPSFSIIDIYAYLVEKNKVFDKKAFKNYTELPCYRYVHANKAKSLRTYFNAELEIYLVFGQIQASQALKKYHSAWILIAKDGEIVNGHCTCMAGFGATCSHVSAILFFILTMEKENEPSCTSLLSSWEKVSKDVEPSPTVDINFSRPQKKGRVQKAQPAIIPVASKESFESFLGSLKTALPTSAVFLAVSDDEETDTDDENISVSEVVQEACSTFAETVKERMNDTFTDSDEARESYYNLCQLSVDDISSVKEITEHQGEKWRAERVGRITASNFGKILRGGCTDSKLLDIMGYRKDPANVPSLEWGRAMEQVAKDKIFEVLSPLHVNLNITSAGLFIDLEDSFLAATPDGFICCDCHPDSLLEIKCPYSLRNESLDVPSKHFFLDEEGRLKENHIYFDQIQGQMGIANINTCYFVTFTTQSLRYELVTFDELKWGYMKDKLNKFFFQTVLPEILEGQKLKELQAANNDCLCKGGKTGVTVQCVLCFKCFHKRCVKYRKICSWTCVNCQNSLFNLHAI